jgi:transcriptional regulator with XRE-family HTH domain
MVAKTPSERNVLATQADDLAVRLSSNMTARRRALGLTQAQVAERLNIDTETVSRFERGKHLPSLATLERLSGLLLTTVGELLAEKPHEANDDDALAITSWLSALQPEDKAFARGLLKQCCDYLSARDKGNQPVKSSGSNSVID